MDIPRVDIISPSHQVHNFPTYTGAFFGLAELYNPFNRKTIAGCVGTVVEFTRDYVPLNLTLDGKPLARVFTNNSNHVLRDRVFSFALGSERRALEKFVEIIRPHAPYTLWKTYDLILFSGEGTIDRFDFNQFTPEYRDLVRLHERFLEQSLQKLESPLSQELRKKLLLNAQESVRQEYGLKLSHYLLKP